MHKDELALGYSCPEDFDAMPRIGPDRACGRCSKVVYDLSARTEGEAKTLYRRGVCVLYRVHRATGRVMFAGALAGSAPALAAGEVVTLPPVETPTADQPPAEVSEDGVSPVEQDGSSPTVEGPTDGELAVPVDPPEPVGVPEYVMLGGVPPI